MKTQHRNIAVHRVSVLGFIQLFITRHVSRRVLLLKDDRMGPPQKVRVQATVQGYLVTWEPPTYGREQVRLYAVRWFRGPSEQLYGRAETTDTYYLGK